MSELEDKLNSILADPAQMEKIAGMARALMGGGDEAPAPAAAPAEGGFDAALLQKLSRAMQAGGAESGKERALLAAMEPYLSEKRRGKMERALRLAKLARLARFAMGEAGDGHDQPL